MKFHFDVSGNDMSLAGKASTDLKKILGRLGVAPRHIKRTAIAMYEGEINMIVHAGGGEADVEIDPGRIEIVLHDRGPGIPNVELAMSEGWSTAPEWIREQGFGAGMGLPNMKKNVDGFDLSTAIGNGTTIRMTIILEGSSNG